ncbi:AMP nucleosidase [Zavarzinia compransoris]|uniref:AMP nucleosidase n=1 Tax=Zavarzinia compransoris TaxID=1264899 RepID=A0A317ED20_9PROT|nr:AMP nucleosidase [Zavarzinia compransoris]PWR24040.1 AMP nucleosidase [Zavarzinia compransoris]TDP48303.1 AMP nucleosidase [Zavarzinia compransoris]
MLTPEAAVDRLDALYDDAVRALIQAVDRFLLDRVPPGPEVRRLFRYPLLRVTCRHVGAQTRNRRAFAKFQQPGVYETTVTHPRRFRTYLLEQLRPLAGEYDTVIEVEPGPVEIPYPYVIERIDEIARAGVTSAEMAEHFPKPELTLVGDEVPDGQWQVGADGVRPLALFDGPRIDFSLRRLVHYTGGDWRNVQKWILLTNYHRYVDEFMRWGIARLAEDNQYQRLEIPGGGTITRGMSPAAAEAVIAASPWHRFQMPAYHLAAADGQGVTLINIGVGPSNAKNITDHLAVLRPNCWLMVGHCAGLRQSQQIGDYVLAHAYLRQDRILDALVPVDVPIPALAEVQVALQDAAAIVTGEPEDVLKERLRTGTVVTNDDRNWELRYTQESRRINLSRAVALDMESGTIAANGYRLRVPYGTLLCVSDKPLHSEIKLPGAANAFYERAVAQHLVIGLKALDLLRERQDVLHSRKLRSFDEPPFR